MRNDHLLIGPKLRKMLMYLISNGMYIWVKCKMLCVMRADRLFEKGG